MRVSIAALIYRSCSYADSVHGSVHKHTPLLRDGEAEFYFVANDPTPRLLSHLRERGYAHHVQRNPHLTDEQLFTLGYGAPEYISRVYRGWNQAILRASGEVVVLVNSDHFFSPGWLENLLAHVRRDRVVCSQLVERRHPSHGIFPGALHAELGSSPGSFDEPGFLALCEQRRRSGLAPGGAYMPCALYKDVAIGAGLYPEGNLAGRSFRDVAACGDQAFFARLASMGVEHVTALDSLVYHTKEGEMDEEAA